MQLGMIGLGRMGANIVRRVMAGGHTCVVYDTSEDNITALEKEGAVGARTLEEFRDKLETPRVGWVMIPASVTAAVVDQLGELFADGDIIIDGGNSNYHSDIEHAKALEPKGIHYVDIGTSGGVFGLQRGYCMMVGGTDYAVEHIDPLLETIAPGFGTAERTDGRTGDLAQAEKGYLHCGGPGAGHFVKMVHNGIEYGIMAAYAEGLNILKGANAGSAEAQHSAEVAPLLHPEFYQYEIDIPSVAEVWRRGSVISSWLLDLTASALAKSPTLEEFGGRVSDSGEGRWTIEAAIDEGVPAPVLATALFERFGSRGADLYANKILSAMRKEFGGHAELPSGDSAEVGKSS